MLVETFDELTPAIKLAQRLSKQNGHAAVIYSNGLYKVFSGSPENPVLIIDLVGERIADYENGMMNKDKD